MAEIDNSAIHLTEDGKNAFDAYCMISGCNSLVFRSNCAPLVEFEHMLPLDQTEEKVKKFWRFEDMFQFENITFSREAETDNGKIKYLACCDCEYGPIGFQDLQTKICYVAANRIRYKES